MAYTPDLNPQPVSGTVAISGTVPVSIAATPNVAVTNTPTVTIGSQPISVIATGAVNIDIDDYQIYSNANITSGAATIAHNTDGSISDYTIKQIVLNCSDFDIFKVEVYIDKTLGATDPLFIGIVTNTASIPVDQTGPSDSLAEDLIIKITRVGAGTANIKVGLVFTAI